MQQIAGDRFDTDILGSEKPVLVDFYADWCGPCKMMAPALESALGKVGDKVVGGKLDVDANQEIATRYAVMGIPTLILFSKGKEVARTSGFRGAAHLEGWIQDALSKV